MSSTIANDGRWMLNEYKTFRELAQRVDQTAMGTNPEKDEITL